MSVPNAGERTDSRLRQARLAFDEAVKLEESGRYPEAIEKSAQALALLQEVQRALAIREAALGKHHPLVAQTLTLLANLHIEQGSYTRAEPLLLRALAIRDSAHGRHPPEAAASLNALACFYRKQGLYARAEPLLQQVLAVRAADLDKDPLLVAQTLNSLAALYSEQGMYARAEPLYERALTILEATLGNRHTDVATLLQNLAGVYRGQGSHARAEPLLLRTLDLRKAALGEQHPLVAQTLTRLAALYSEQGLNGRAEPLLEQALAIQEKVLGEQDPDVALTLESLAILYHEQGLYSRARPLFERALALQEAALDSSPLRVATSLDNLAGHLMTQGLYDQARPLHERALALREGTLDKHHPHIADSLFHLASLHHAQGQYDRAEPLYARAIAIKERTLGGHHPTLADWLNNLASLYLEQGLYSRAEPLYERARTIQEAVLGRHHPELADTLTDLALLRLGQRRLAEAVPLFTQALAISEERLRHEALTFSESRLVRFLQHLRAEEERIYALLRENPEDAGVLHLALTTVLLRKGRSVEETASTWRTLYRGLGAQDREALERLRDLRSQIARLSQDTSLSPNAYQERLKQLTAQADEFEAVLARRSAPLRALRALPPPMELVGRVAAALPPDGALVEFIAYADRPLLPKPGTLPSQLQGQLRYLALVLFPDARILAVDLGPAAPIDRASSRLRDALALRDARWEQPAQALYSLAFQPLLPLPGNQRRLFLAPDGQLALVPFAALHDGQGPLVDTFDFSYLTSGKELLPRAEEQPVSRSVVVLADPAFAPPRVATPLAEPPWPPLPGTRQEALAIQRLVPQAELFLGPDATRERLLGLSSPGILHVATHGFFLEEAPPPANSRAVGHLGAIGGRAPPLPPRASLLRSGLILAGASAPAPTAPGAMKPRPENHRVTALELAGLDLWGTELVVLSACDTGRGDVKLGQGVYGLRRALVVAGAETVVMSLWKVNDDSTRLLMEDYYRHLLSGKGRASALRDAMRTLRETWPHPHYWAPFIAVGRDAPLRSLAPDSLHTRLVR